VWSGFLVAAGEGGEGRRRGMTGKWKLLELKSECRFPPVLQKSAWQRPALIYMLYGKGRAYMSSLVMECIV